MTRQGASEPYLSVVVPLFDEADNVAALVKALIDEVSQGETTYELLLIDDGSRDATWPGIQQASSQNAHVRGIRLARNFGHQHALLAGLSLSKGQVIITMDGDLQHPPSLIPELLRSHGEGYLVVNTRRDDVEISSYFKRTTSALFYKVFSFMTDVPMEPGSSDFRLLDRTVLDQLIQLKDVDLFLRGAVEWLGFPSTVIPYTANPRFSGTTKYSLKRMLKFAKGSIISFSTKPLILGIWLGVSTSALAFLEILYILYRVYTGRPVEGWASTVGIVSFLFGVLFIMLGIMGTYLSRIHVALQNRPRYIVMDRCDPRDAR